MSDDDLAPTSDATPPSKLPPNKRFPAREDCWSESATRTLIEEWGSQHLQLNRGNLTQKHWQQIADAVNAVHVSPRPRSDIQCKNRIDTVKKKFKIEKSKVSQSKGRYISSWPFFQTLEPLIASNYNHVNDAVKPLPSSLRKTHRALPPLPSSIPVAPRSKRPLSDDAVFRRNFSAMAAAAAAVEAKEREREGRGQVGESEGFFDTFLKRGGKQGPAAKLAAAIERLGKIYERVEEAKQRQMVELEKQRMQFVKDLEVQRMKWYVDSQLQLHEIKRSKHPSSDNVVQDSMENRRFTYMEGIYGKEQRKVKWIPGLLYLVLLYLK